MLEELGKIKEKFKIGDIVRKQLSEIKGKLEKSYKQNWTDTIYKIISVSKGKIPIYKIHNLILNKDVKHYFTSSELLKINIK